MSPHTSHVALVALREAVVAGEMTAAQAAESVGIPRGTLYGRWRSTGLLEGIPMPRWGTSRATVRRIIESDPSLSDSGIAQRMTEEGTTIRRTTVTAHRISMGIPPRDERMREVDPSWKANRSRLSDADLIEARRKIEARESTVRRQALELGVCSETLYNRWRRLEVIHSRPKGRTTAGPPTYKRRRAPVRDEVAAHMREYPWMRASHIADSMTADGYPIRPYRVRQHMQTIRILHLL